MQPVLFAAAQEPSHDSTAATSAPEAVQEPTGTVGPYVDWIRKATGSGERTRYAVLRLSLELRNI